MVSSLPKYTPLPTSEEPPPAYTPLPASQGSPPKIKSAARRCCDAVANFFKRPFSSVGVSLTSRHVQRRESLEALGAQVTCVDSGLGVVQSTHLSVASFHTTLQKLGCTRVKLSTGKEACTAFQVPRAKRKALEQALTKAEFFSNGWTLFEAKNGEVYLTASAAFEAFSPAFKKNGRKCDVEALPLERRKSAGTVVLIGGVHSVSSSGYNCGELATWVLLGMNVQLLDFPGFGESTGAFSQASIDAALAAVIEDLKITQGIDNKDILLKGTCFGAGPVVAYAASQAGQGCHVLVTDTAETTDALVGKAVASRLGKGRVSTALARVVVAPVLGTHYDLSADIRRTTGGVAVLRNRRDDYFGPDEMALEDPLVEALTASMRSSGKRRLTYIVAETGGHATPWQRDPIGAEQVRAYVDQLTLDRARMF